MKPSIWKSRKFWLMVLDVAVSTATYFLTAYAAPDVAKNVIWLIATWQPIFIALIIAITQEDVAFLNSQMMAAWRVA